MNVKSTCCPSSGFLPKAICRSITLGIINLQLHCSEYDREGRFTLTITLMLFLFVQPEKSASYLTAITHYDALTMTSRLPKYAKIRRPICVFYYILHHATGYSVQYAEIGCVLVHILHPGPRMTCLPLRHGHSHPNTWTRASNAHCVLCKDIGQHIVFNERIYM